MLTLNIANQTDVNLSLNFMEGNLEVIFLEGIKDPIFVLILLLIGFTIFSNILVILAFIADKRLRTQSNFFLLNLAICDFFIGAFSMPLCLLYLKTGKWVLGGIVCKLWLTIDYTMCTASTFNIALISYDRFFAVTKAVSYRSQQNKYSHTVLKMVAVWILSFLLYGPTILFWEKTFGEPGVPDGICQAQFLHIWYINFLTSVFDFALPLVCISFFNMGIYWDINKRSKKKRNCSKSLSKENQRSPFVIATNFVLFSSQMQQNQHVEGPAKERIKRSSGQYIDYKGLFSPTVNTLINANDVQIIQLSRDKKIAKSLLILVCNFAICWSPHTFIIIIENACNGCYIDSLWQDIAAWLLYMNSGINPILYPLCHKSFRNSFKTIFRNSFKIIFEKGCRKYHY